MNELLLFFTLIVDLSFALLLLFFSSICNTMTTFSHTSRSQYSIDPRTPQNLDLTFHSKLFEVDFSKKNRSFRRRGEKGEVEYKIIWVKNFVQNFYLVLQIQSNGWIFDNGPIFDPINWAGVYSLSFQCRSKQASHQISCVLIISNLKRESQISCFSPGMIYDKDTVLWW